MAQNDPTPQDRQLLVERIATLIRKAESGDPEATAALQALQEQLQFNGDLDEASRNEMRSVYQQAAEQARQQDDDGSASPVDDLIEDIGSDLDRLLTGQAQQFNDNSGVQVQRMDDPDREAPQQGSTDIPNPMEALARAVRPEDTEAPAVGRSTEEVARESQQALEKAEQPDSQQRGTEGQIPPNRRTRRDNEGASNEDSQEQAPGNTDPLISPHREAREFSQQLPAGVKAELDQLIQDTTPGALSDERLEPMLVDALEKAGFSREFLEGDVLEMAKRYLTETRPSNMSQEEVDEATSGISISAREAEPAPEGEPVMELGPRGILDPGPSGADAPPVTSRGEPRSIEARAPKDTEGQGPRGIPDPGPSGADTPPATARDINGILSQFGIEIGEPQLENLINSGEVRLTTPRSRDGGRSGAANPMEFLRDQQARNAGAAAGEEIGRRAAPQEERPNREAPPPREEAYNPMLGTGNPSASVEDTNQGGPAPVPDGEVQRTRDGLVASVGFIRDLLSNPVTIKDDEGNVVTRTTIRELEQQNAERQRGRAAQGGGQGGAPASEGARPSRPSPDPRQGGQGGMPQPNGRPAPQGPQPQGAMGAATNGDITPREARLIQALMFERARNQATARTPQQQQARQSDGLAPPPGGTAGSQTPAPQPSAQPAAQPTPQRPTPAPSGGEPAGGGDAPAPRPRQRGLISPMGPDDTSAEELNQIQRSVDSMRDDDLREAAQETMASGNRSREGNIILTEAAQRGLIRRPR